MNNTLDISKDNYQLNFPKYYTQSLYHELTSKEPNNVVFKWINRFLNENCKVVELGLNPGTLTIDLVRMGINVLGVDSSPKKIVFAQHINHVELERYQIFKNHIDFEFPFEDFITSKFKIMNLNNLDIESENVDIVFSDGGLSSVNLLEVLIEAKRIIKQNGVLILRLNINKNLVLNGISNKKQSAQRTLKWLKDWASLNGFKILQTGSLRKYQRNNLKSIINTALSPQNVLFVAEKQG